jgi:hypothetical protein
MPASLLWQLPLPRLSVVLWGVIGFTMVGVQINIVSSLQIYHQLVKGNFKLDNLTILAIVI